MTEAAQALEEKQELAPQELLYMTEAALEDESDNLDADIPASLPDALLNAELLSQNGGPNSERAEKVRKKLKAYLNDNAHIIKFLNETEDAIRKGEEFKVGRTDPNQALWQVYQNVSYYQSANNAERDLHDDDIDARVAKLYTHFQSQGYIQQRIAEQAEKATEAEKRNEENWAVHLPNFEVTPKDALSQTETDLTRFEGRANDTNKSFFTKILEEIRRILKSPKAEAEHRIPPVSAQGQAVDNSNEIDKTQSAKVEKKAAPEEAAVKTPPAPASAAPQAAAPVEPPAASPLSAFEAANKQAFTQDYDSLSAMALEAELKSIRQEMKGFVAHTQEYNRQASSSIHKYSTAERYADFLQYEAEQKGAGMALTVDADGNMDKDTLLAYAQQDIVKAGQYSQHANAIHEQYQTRLNAIQNRLAELHDSKPSDTTRAMVQAVDHANIIFGELRIISPVTIAEARKVVEQHHKAPAVSRKEELNSSANAPVVNESAESNLDDHDPVEKIESELKSHKANTSEFDRKYKYKENVNRAEHEQGLKTILDHRGSIVALVMKLNVEDLSPDSTLTSDELGKKKNKFLSQLATISGSHAATYSKLQSKSEHETEKQRAQNLVNLASEFKKKIKSLNLPQANVLLENHKAKVDLLVTENDNEKLFTVLHDAKDVPQNDRGASRTSHIFNQFVESFEEEKSAVDKAEKAVVQFQTLSSDFATEVKNFSKGDFPNDSRAFDRIAAQSGQFVNDAGLLKGWLVTDAQKATMKARIEALKTAIDKGIELEKTKASNAKPSNAEDLKKQSETEKAFKAAVSYKKRQNFYNIEKKKAPPSGGSDGPK